MQVKKIITGFVVQTFDTEKDRFISQEFVAGEQVDVEDEKGDAVSADLLGDAILPLVMVQPDRGLKGKCPRCGGKLEYGNTKLQDDAFGYEVACPNCGFNGWEWYDLRFSEHMDTAGNPVLAQGGKDGGK